MTTLPNGHDSRVIDASCGFSRTYRQALGSFKRRLPCQYSDARRSGTSRRVLFRSSTTASRAHSQVRTNVDRRLRVMKFGGTSVGDASCIARVVEIIRAAARESNVAVVVSAMSGVTNKLVEAATLSQAGDREGVAAIFKELRARHEAVATALIHSAAERKRICRKIREIIQEGDALCRGAILLRELSLRTRDAISSLGERLAAPLVAAALADLGVASEATDTTELVVTNASHGAAEPLMDLTGERCKARLRPLLQRGVVPVVTGFIGATVEGVVTTLGRNGSDYSATILGAALEADEIIIWSDVDGVLTVDPRLVPGVCRIPEISYREAAELAYFGAKVLHPKTLRPVMRTGTPIWIRNTFAPRTARNKNHVDGRLERRRSKSTHCD